MQPSATKSKVVPDEFERIANISDVKGSDSRRHDDRAEVKQQRKHNEYDHNIRVTDMTPLLDESKEQGNTSSETLARETTTVRIHTGITATEYLCC